MDSTDMGEWAQAAAKEEIDAKHAMTTEARVDMVNEGVRLMLRHRDTVSAVEAILDMHSERLRAQVEALPAAMIVAGVWIGEPPDRTDWDDPVVFQSDVLAVLGGES